MKPTTIKITACLAVAGVSAAAVAAIDRGGVTRGRLDSETRLEVNGIEYDASQAVFDIDGVTGTQNDLEPGQILEVDDITYPEGALQPVVGTVSFVDNVQGPVTDIYAAARTIRILGQTVIVESNTHFGSEIPDFESISIGDVIEVSGFFGAAGETHATRIDIAPSGMFEVTGEAVAVSEPFLYINGLTVDLTPARLAGFGLEVIDGDFIEVKGVLVDPGNLVLEAHSVATRSRGLTGDALQEANLAGVVSRYVTQFDFDVDGTPVVVTGSTTFVNGSEADLGPGVVVNVVGELNETGTVIVASEIEFPAEAGE